MDSSVDILRLCRLCLVKDQVNVPIFDEEDVRQVFLKISTCLPVKISENDELPKKICDGCSHKLDSFYEFWTSTGSAQETLLSLIAQKAQTLLEPTIPKPINVKKETEALEESSKDDTEEPASKRPRRSAAIKAQSSIMPESDDEDGDLDTTEIVTKEEIEELESSYTEMAGSSVDEAQPGPSGVGKNEVEPGVTETIYLEVEEPARTTVQLAENNRIIPRLMHWCHICGKCFNRNLDLNKHFAFVHFGDKRHQCKHCTANYKEKESLLNHIRRSHKKERVVLCETCGTICSDVFHLKKHRAEVHAQSNRVTCEWCHEDFDTERAFKKHFKQHTRETVKTCHLCQEPFYLLSKYRHHMRTSHTDKFLVCRYCSKLFVSEAELHKHETLHNYTSEPKKLEECPVCQKRVKNLKNHLADVHFLEEVEEVDEKEYVCDVCGAQFKLEILLNRHMTKHIKKEIEA